MVLLFLSVWAIIIALNEVLFAAQPFSLISIAAALPHTLMFSVVLSAAVYVAKKKIIDAIDKGQPIDKRFVADLTPEVGHELNAMRKKLAHMDPKQAREYKAKVVAAARARACARARSGVGKQPPNLNELEQQNRARLAQNRTTYGHLYQTAQTKLRQDELKKQKAQQKAHAKATRAARKKDALKEARAQAAIKSGKVAAATQHKNAGSFLSSMFGGTDPNDFVKEAHAQLLQQAEARAEARHGYIKNRLDKLTPKGAARSQASAANASAKAAADKRAQEEQARARRQAQIEALGAISSEDKAKQEQELQDKLKERKAKEAAAAKAKQAKAQQEQEQLKKLKHSLDPNASKAEVKAQTQKIKEQGAKAAAEKAAADQAAAEQKAAEQAAAEKAAAEKKASEQAAAAQAAEKAAAEKKVAAESKTVSAAAAQQADTAAFMQSTATALQAGAKNVKDLERLQAQAHTMQEQQAAQAQEQGAKPAAMGYMDQLIIPKSNNVDTSGLKKHQGPKRGAGLDTSALKRAVPVGDSGPTAFNPPQLTTGAVQGAGVSSSGGARLLNSNSTRSTLGVGPTGGSAGAGLPNAQMAGAAFGTTLQNDATIERGKAQSLDFASYQANARERALGRAQAPKATAQAQHIAAATHRSVTGLNLNTQTQAQPKAQSHSAPAGGKLTAPGNRAAFTAQMQRPGLASTHMGEQGPIRQVVAGTKPVVGPARDTLPKVLPSPGIESIQSAPKLRSKRVINAQKRDQMFKRELTFVDEAPSQAHMDALAAQTDKLHAQDHADAYSKVQSQTTAQLPGAASSAPQHKRARARPSDKLRADEQV